MTTTSAVLAGVFLDPPVDAVAQYPLVPLVAAAGMAVISAVIGVIYTWRTRSPLYIWCTVAGVALYPLLVEPFGDLFVAVWYPTNHEIVATVFDRPMPWFALFFYAGGIPFASVAAYEIVKRGAPAKRLLQLIVVVAIIEVPGEMIASHFGWMQYYGNHAVIGGVPIYCLVQNAGMFAVVAWVLAWLMPHIRGWRWILVPFAVGATLPVFALVATFPAYIAIATDATPLVGWLAGILATAMNAAVVIACVYSPTLQRLRKSASPATAPPQAVHVS